MDPLILFALLTVVPVVLVMLLRVNAAVLFMSLCVGQVLVQYLSGEANEFISTLLNHQSQISDSTIKLFLLLTPPVLTLLFMLHSVRGFKLFLNLFPAIGVGLLVPLLIKPLLSDSFQNTLEQASLWHQFSRAQTLVVGISALLSLFFLWIGRNSAHDKHGKGKHH